MGHKPRKRGWILRAGLTVILSVATTGAVAWACAVFDSEGNTRKRQWITGAYITSLAFREGWGVTDLSWFAIANDGLARFTAEEEPPPYWSRSRQLAGPFVSATKFSIPELRVEVASGWPWRALRAEFRRNSTGVRGQGNSLFSLERGIELPARFIRRHGNQRSAALPYDPIWPGLCGDVVLYAAAWWGLMAGVPAVRRLGRKRRGLCPECGYDLRGEFAFGCSECGWEKQELQSDAAARA